MGHVGKGATAEPVFVGGVFMRLADGRPQQAGVLRLAPRRAVIGVRSHETLDHLQLVGCTFVHGPGTRNRAGFQVGGFGRCLQVGRHAVAREEGNQVGFVPRRYAPGHDPAAILGVGHARGAADVFGGMAAGLPVDRRAAHHPGHQVDLGALRHCFMHRTRHLLAVASVLCMYDRGRDAHREVFTGDVVSVPELRRHRRQVVVSSGVGVVAAIHHHAAQGEVHQVAALEVLPGTGVAERRHARNDQVRITGEHGFAVEPEQVVAFTAGCIEQHIGTLQQVIEFLAPVVRAELDRQLSPVVVPEMQRLFRVLVVVAKRPDTPGGGTVARFDLDNLRAQAGQHQPAMFARLVPDLDHAQAGVGAGQGNRCRSNRGQVRWVSHVCSRKLSIYYRWVGLIRKAMRCAVNSGVWVFD